MTIRTRLTLWYSGVLLTSLILMVGVIYYEFVIERAQHKAEGKPPDTVRHEIFEVVLYYGVPTGVLTIIGGWLLLRKALTPLHQLAAAAEQLQLHNLRQELPCTGNGDEVDRLTKTLNAANARLLDSFNRIGEFTLHASHELKTPLTILHGEIEAALT
ncbi:MAG: HAMP domain-containing protein [Verrucomicrobiota bacterium]